MKLKEAIDQWERELKTASKINFANKSKFIGITNDGDKIVLSPLELESDSWGFLFESYDKEFIAAVNGILGDE